MSTPNPDQALPTDRELLLQILAELAAIRQVLAGKDQVTGLVDAIAEQGLALARLEKQVIKFR